MKRKLKRRNKRHISSVFKSWKEHDYFSKFLKEDNRVVLLRLYQNKPLLPVNLFPSKRKGYNFEKKA